MMIINITNNRNKKQNKKNINFSLLIFVLDSKGLSHYLNQVKSGSVFRRALDEIRRKDGISSCWS